MLSWLQFITTPTVDTPGTALLLFFDDKRYVIGNIHEGLTRAVAELGIRLGKVSDIFIAGEIKWKNTGGLVGTILSIGDTVKANSALGKHMADRQECQQSPTVGGQVSRSREGVNNVEPDENRAITVHGGPNLAHTFATMRHFVFRRGVPLLIDEYSQEMEEKPRRTEWKPDWVDDRIQVWNMPVAPIRSDHVEAFSKSESPLKRSFHEFWGGETPCAESNSDPTASSQKMANNAAEDMVLRKMVISQMFNSSWRHDDLVEIPLADVVMPASIFVRDKSTNTVLPYQGPMPGGTSPLPQMDVLIRRPWPGSRLDQLPFTRPSPIAMSYIFRKHRQRGKFMPEKATALQVPSGKQWGLLADGLAVQSMDGRTITPDMVLGESTDGRGVAVVDLPTPDYVHNLVTRPEWQASEVMSGVEMVIWILGPGVEENTELQTFMNEFKHVQHVVSSLDHCANRYSFDTAAAAAIRLRQIDAPRHPPLICNNEIPPQPSQPAPGLPCKPKIIQAERGLKAMLQPRVSLKEDEIPPTLDVEEVMRRTPWSAIKLAKSAMENLSSEGAQQESASQNLPSPEAEIVSLGTGSASPSKYRNVSGTLLRVPGSGSYLLDCGENTLGQLKRLYNPQELREIFRDLKLVWISHLHADHHLGLTSVIRAWYEEHYPEQQSLQKRRRPSLMELLTPPTVQLQEKGRLCVVTGERMLHWLKEYSGVEDFGYNRLTLICSTTVPTSYPATKLTWQGRDVIFNGIHENERSKVWRETTGLSDLQACPVIHCVEAQAVSLTFPTGFKFSYSGDCRPCSRFAKIGQGSTVLLHEATFDDELRADAKEKKHSTTSEAIGVGVAMGARRILLTHFSTRYQKLPVMNEKNGLNIKLETNEDFINDRLSEDGMLAPDYSEETVHDEITPLPAPQQADSMRPSLSSPTRFPVSLSSQQMPKDLRIGVVFDHMRVKVADIMHLEKFTPALLKLYECVGLDEKIGKAKNTKTSAKTTQEAAKVDRALAAERRNSKSRAEGIESGRNRRKLGKDRSRDGRQQEAKETSTEVFEKTSGIGRTRGHVKINSDHTSRPRGRQRNLSGNKEPQSRFDKETVHRRDERDRDEVTVT